MYKFQFLLKIYNVFPTKLFFYVSKPKPVFWECDYLKIIPLIKYLNLIFKEPKEKWFPKIHLCWSCNGGNVILVNLLGHIFYKETDQGDLGGLVS